MPTRVALTGGIATGKSRCLSAFAALGVPTIDADQLAREAVAPGTAGLEAIVRHFGASVVTASGGLDREALGAIVFKDAQARKALEAIVHPYVYDRITRWFAVLDEPFGVADVPLLFETDRTKDFDVIVVAACRPDQQVERLMTRSGLTESEARARIDAQWPLEDKVAKAHHVIDTSGSLDETDARVRELWLSWMPKDR